jgi:hypothetical protein
MISRSKQPNEELFIYRRLTDAELSQYEEKGYLHLGRRLTDAGLARFREEVMAAWRAEKGEYDAEGSWLKNALLPNIHHQSSAVRNYYFGGPIVDVAEQIIGPNIKGATTQLTFKMRGNTQTFSWHQDNGYGELEPYNAISTLTALDDAEVETGCLWLIPGSHKGGQVEVEYAQPDRDGHAAISLNIDDSGAIPMPIKAGESLIFSCWMLHKSEGNRAKDRDRRFLYMRYADADAVEVYNDRKPRLGRLVRGETKFPEVEAFEADLD